MHYFQLKEILIKKYSLVKSVLKHLNRFKSLIFISYYAVRGNVKTQPFSVQE